MSLRVRVRTGHESDLGVDAGSNHDVRRWDREHERYRKAQLRRHRVGMLGVAVVMSLVIFSFLGPLVSGHDPNQQDLANRLAPVWTSVEGKSLHVLGTDPLGRDIMTRLAVGGRASLAVALAALVLGGGLGFTLGTIAGYFGGWIDNIIARLIDAQLALPNLIFAMIVASVLGRGFWKTVLALGFSTWPIYARLLRGEVLQLRAQEFVPAAKMVGSSTTRLLRVHIVPNALNVAIVVGSLELGRMILVESGLSYVGLGIQPPNASWGTMLRQGQQYIFEDWRLATIPGFLIMAAVLGMNLIGDWLRDVLDPRSK